MKGPKITLDPERFSDEGQEFYEFLKGQIFGQERAIRRLVRAYELFLSPFRKLDKPAVFLLFPGPSGTGKTYLAELTAEFLLGSKSAMTRLDCTSITHGHEVSKWVGSPPGYVNSYDTPALAQNEINRPAREKIDEESLNDPDINRLSKEIFVLGSELEETKKKKDAASISALNHSIRQKQNLLEARQEQLRYAIFRRTKGRMVSIILFDEVEKAHPDAYKLLMSIAETAKLAMVNEQKTTSFINSFVFLTSNAGSRAIQKKVALGGGIGLRIPDKTDKPESAIWKTAVSELEKIFDPEFIGRIYHDIVVFHALKPEEIQSILDKQLAWLYADLIGDAGINIRISDEVYNMIYNDVLEHPEFGARPIRQKVDELLRSPLAVLVNSKQIGRNDSVYIELDGGKIVFEKESYLPKPYKLKEWPGITS